MADTQADLVSLRHRLEGLSARLQSHAKAGFGFISEMDANEFSTLMEYIVTSMENSTDLDDTKGAELSGLSDKRVQNIFTASTLVGYAILDFDLDPQSLAKILPVALIDEDNRQSAEKVARVFFDRKSQLQDGIDKKRLASTVLPIFQRLNIEVDLRFEFDSEDQVKRVVPIAIAHVETDNGGDELFLQVDLPGVESLIASFSKVRERMLKIGKVRIEHG